MKTIDCELAEKIIEESTEELSSSTNTPHKFQCPECHADLQKRKDKNGVWWGCSSYPLCKVVRPDDNGRPGEIKTYNCPECDGVLVRFKAKTGKFCFACFEKENHASCKTIFWNDDNGKPSFIH